jgi:uncharacterized protein
MTDISAGQAAVDMPPPPIARIATLDIVRGIAVMGILTMNILAFSSPFQAYMNPIAYGAVSQADIASWAFNFVVFDGKMRGLFSFLFGASTLLVIERAAASGESPAKVHYMRMIWLLLFGLIHFYFIWFGDILALYALMGLLLFFFRNLSTRALVKWGIGFVFIQLLVFGSFAFGALYLSGATQQPGADAELATQWAEMQRMVVLTDEHEARKMALYLGPWSGLVDQRLLQRGFEPFTGPLLFGWETLAYMLFGMAALKTGFFRGEWGVERYRKTALIGFAIGIPVYVALAWLLIRANFAPEMVFAYAMAATVPFRPVMVLAVAALIILLTRNGGALVDRIAATGRMAFTNYLMTSIIMTTIFYGYGFGLYGTLGRTELWIPVLGMWALMLIWSKPWLDRFNYGPLEWLWRSLARTKFQPMRKGAVATAEA